MKYMIMILAAFACLMPLYSEEDFLGNPIEEKVKADKFEGTWESKRFWECTAVIKKNGRGYTMTIDGKKSIAYKKVKDTMRFFWDEKMIAFVPYKKGLICNTYKPKKKVRMSDSLDDREKFKWVYSNVYFTRKTGDK